MSRLKALVTNRCPYCLRGKVFTGVWRMPETCPECGIIFAREDGYFMMSVFIGYVICAVAVIPAIVLMYLLQASPWWYLGSSALVLLPLTPLIFRYSRLIWLHLDEVLDPRPR